MTTPPIVPPARSIRADAKFHTMRLLGRTVSLAARSTGRLRGQTLRQGSFSVLTVNWNSVDFLAAQLKAVERFSPPDTQVIVVDNASADGSRELLKASQIKSVLLPINIGHGPALDIATALVTTEFFVTLDIDAFPISNDWLTVLRSYLDSGSRVVGGHMHRGFAHPSMLAMRTRDFRDRKHTFVRSSWRTSADFEHGKSWDVGELISMREPERVALVQPSEVRGPGVIGTVYGGIVYHNACSTHGREKNRIQARAAWTDAQDRFLGSGTTG